VITRPGVVENCVKRRRGAFGGRGLRGGTFRGNSRKRKRHSKVAKKKLRGLYRINSSREHEVIDLLLLNRGRTSPTAPTKRKSVYMAIIREGGSFNHFQRKNRDVSQMHRGRRRKFKRGRGKENKGVEILATF